MFLERVTRIELNVDEQRRIALDYLQRRRQNDSNALSYHSKYRPRAAAEYERTLKNEMAALDAVIRILENEI